MNIALPAILVFLFMLPGFIFSLYFYDVENAQLAPLTRRAITSIFVSAILSFLTFPLLLLLTQGQINLEVLFIGLSAASSNVAYFAAIKLLGDHFGSILFYCLFLSALARLLVIILRAVIQKFNLERFEWFRVNNSWYYLFAGYDWPEGAQGVLVAAVLEFNHQAYLYVGALEKFFLDSNGKLEHMILTSVARRKIERDKTDNSEEDQTRFYPVDGDYFVLKYSEVKNLNLQFIKLEKIL